jgi:hypothetical protein
MTSYVTGLVAHEGVYCSYRLTARRRGNGVALTARVRPVIRVSGASGGWETVVPCAENLAGQFAAYVGVPSTACVVQIDRFWGEAYLRMDVPTSTSSRALLEDFGEEFSVRHRIDVPERLLRSALRTSR